MIATVLVCGCLAYLTIFIAYYIKAYLDASPSERKLLIDVYDVIFALPFLIVWATLLWAIVEGIVGELP